MYCASHFDLHPAQAGALMQLDAESGLPMHEIAAHLACDNSNVTGIVDRLEGARAKLEPRYRYLPIFTIRDFGITPPEEPRT